MNDAFILLGTNVDREKNLRRAMQLLREYCDVRSVSSVYETIAVGPSPQPDFLNAIVHIRTPLAADTLKARILRQIESALRRVRVADRNAPRTIDADIILFNDDVIDANSCRIPDPDLLRYPHIAVPMSDIAPHRLHPENHRSMAENAAIVQRRHVLSGGSPDSVRCRHDIQLAASAPIN